MNSRLLKLKDFNDDDEFVKRCYKNGYEEDYYVLILEPDADKIVKSMRQHKYIHGFIK